MRMWLSRGKKTRFLFENFENEFSSKNDKMKPQMKQKTRLLGKKKKKRSERKEKKKLRDIFHVNRFFFNTN